MKLPWIRKQFRKRPRVFIFTTRMGGYLNGLIFLMFLLSVGYTNNLLLIFTLCLFGLNLLWVIQTHFHMHALRPETVLIEDGFAGEQVLVTCVWKKTPALPHSWDITIETENESFTVKRLEDSESKSFGYVIFPKRGIVTFAYLKVRTNFPFGLYFTWIYFPITTKAWIYPPRLKEKFPFDAHNSPEEGERASARAGTNDIWNLAPYQGEESRRISWKHYARVGELVVKEGEELEKAVVTFQIRSDLKKIEFVLSKIATQMLDCHAEEIMFNLETPQKKIGFGQGQKHLTDCLRELSKC